MAKKPKRTKRVKRKVSKPPISLEPECPLELALSDAILKEPETVRRLAHCVVDLLADSGNYKHLSQSVSINLGSLVDGFVIDRITGLIEEARAARKEAPRG